MRHPHDFADVVGDGCQIARLQLTDIHHHIDFHRPIFDGAFGFVNFGLGRHCAKRKTDRRADLHVRTCQGGFAVGDPVAVDADRAEIICEGLFAQDRDLLRGRVWLEESVVDNADQGDGMVGGIVVHAGINLFNTTFFIEIGRHGLPV